MTSAIPATGLISIAIIIGAVVFQSAVVAPSVFGALDGDQAGQLLRRLFPAFFRLEIACGVIAAGAFGAAAAIGLPGTGPLALAASVAITLLAILSLALVAPINRARDAGDRAASRFRLLHGLSVALTLLVLLLGVAILFGYAAAAGGR